MSHNHLHHIHIQVYYMHNHKIYHQSKHLCNEDDNIFLLHFLYLTMTNSKFGHLKFVKMKLMCVKRRGGKKNEIYIHLTPIQSPPSQSHALTLHAISQYPSPIQDDEHPSLQFGTSHDRNTFCPVDFE